LGKKTSTTAGVRFQTVAPLGTDALQFPVKMLSGRMLKELTAADDDAASPPSAPHRIPRPSSSQNTSRLLFSILRPKNVFHFDHFGHLTRAPVKPKNLSLICWTIRRYTKSLSRGHEFLICSDWPLIEWLERGTILDPPDSGLSHRNIPAAERTLTLHFALKIFQNSPNFCILVSNKRKEKKVGAAHRFGRNFAPPAPKFPASNQRLDSFKYSPTTMTISPPKNRPPDGV
jgi:hypothetical protein